MSDDPWAAFVLGIFVNLVLGFLWIVFSIYASAGLVWFSHVSGRKKIETSHPTEFQTNSPILRAIARGMAWLRMLDEGKVSSIHDLADTLKLERKYMRAPACAPLCGSPLPKVPYELRSSVHSTLRLAFLSSRVIRAIKQGEEPDGRSRAALRTTLAAASQWAFAQSIFLTTAN